MYSWDVPVLIMESELFQVPDPQHSCNSGTARQEAGVLLNRLNPKAQASLNLGFRV